MLELIGLGLVAMFGPLVFIKAIADEGVRLDEELAECETQESQGWSPEDLARHIAEVNAKNAGL